MQPKTDLFDRIKSRIEREEKWRALSSRLILRSAGLVVSLSLFLPLIFKLAAEIAGSGLAGFLSLMFTDYGLVMSNLTDYLLTILESTPVMSLTLTLAALLAMVLASAKLADSLSDFKKLAVN